MDHLLLKYPNRVPVVIRNCKLDKTKYLTLYILYENACV